MRWARAVEAQHQPPRAAAARLPDEPGVYRFRDGGGRVLYLGRAVSLRRRTDQGTFRFAIADPKTLARLAGPVREFAFSPDGTLYLLEPTSLTAIGGDGMTKWKTPLLDGRRLVGAKRAVVLDGTDRLLAFAPADGTAEELGAGGTMQDLTMSSDGRVVGALVDARRAVLFTLP